MNEAAPRKRVIKGRKNPPARRRRAAPGPSVVYRLSPLLKTRLFFGMPVAIGLTLLFFLAPVTLLMRSGPDGMGSTGFIITLVFALLVALAMFAIGGTRAATWAKILERPVRTNARIERIELTRLNQASLDQSVGNNLRTLHLSLADEAGNSWRATYQAGMLGEDLNEGDWLECIYQADDPGNVLPVKYLFCKPEYGEDGLVRTGRKGETWGYLAFSGFILIEWLLALVL